MDSKYLTQLTDQFLDFIPTLAGAIVALFVGFYVCSIINKIIEKALIKKDIAPSLRGFLLSVIRVFLKIVVIISALSMLGVQTTSFIAILGSAGLAIGLALQGSLSNFAGGVLILFLKPFKVGDFIEAQGKSGTVDSINIFVTKIKTPDNKVILIPNGPLANGIIMNVSAEETRRVDMTFGIAYEDDISQAKDVIKKTVLADERVLNEPEPVIMVTSLGDSSVNISIRVWANAADYWGIYHTALEEVKLALDLAKISIPYPQRQVHMSPTKS